MKKQFLFFLGTSLLAAVPCFAQLRASNNPTGAAVVVTQPSAVFVTWILESGTSAPSTISSPEGLFVLGDQVLGQVTTSLTTNVAPNGTGTATETLLIPPDVSNKAFKQKAPTFFYRRTFTSSADGSSANAALTCRLSTSAYGNFSIGAVTIYFRNQRGESTFEQNDPNAKAYAEVHYNGTGLMKAQWEVEEPNSSDFRVLQQVNYHLTFGDRLVFESPSVPPLPTILTGRYTVRFHILQPVSGFEIPSITYYVKPPASDEPKPALRSISPPAEARVTSETSFTWSGEASGSTLIRFSVYERSSLTQLAPTSSSVDPLSKPSTGSLQSTDLFPVKGVEVFSATLPAGTSSYLLKAGQWERLNPDKGYLWQVQAVDAAGKVISETELRSFLPAGTRAQAPPPQTQP